ncbi:hypothetical protein crov117 [Cafeteria roenbergensis virus]|uniref:Uncharacterized protein n=1 Tax=Cafeteria roenbergensis virus (strain BV-PW1) TaxID=693272 RepID=E3T4N7_CROVB|nr:hypothetical protein crov117 [Cafeteria roenbergensis virus BV-PW1]ADO67150.1 hypothetical protein crov117 [Cafeteria roenbergensis virus BV-PW1]
MTNYLHIDEYILSYTIIKHNKKIYLITTPHGIYINKNREYTFIKDTIEYNCKLYKQSYWCDLAIFNITSKITLKISELKILKSSNLINQLQVQSKNNHIIGNISNIVYLCHLDINGGNRIIYYQMNILKGTITQGCSGSGMYHKNKLIGLISNTNKDATLLVPSFFILKVLTESKSNYSPYLPIKLTMEKDKIILLNSYLGLKKGCTIVKFNNLIITKGHVYCSEIKDNIPLDVYLQIFCTVNEIVNISDGKFIHKVKIKNLNDYLTIPFISGISREEKNKITKITFQDIWDINTPETIKLLNHNLSICEMGNAV